LDSLTVQRCKHYEILVVLNSQTNEDFAQRLRRYPIRLLHEPRAGVCVARNRGIPAARGEILCFLDDDVTVDSDWIHEVLAGFKDPQVACVTGRVLVQGGFLSQNELERAYCSKRATSEWTLDPSLQPDWYRIVLGPDVGYGCNMAFRREFLEKHTAFPEGMGAGALIAAGDDTFMFFQVLKHDLRLHHSPRAVATHSYDNDEAKQKSRAMQVCSALAAVHLKLIVEEKRFRFATMKVVASALARRIGRLIHNSEGRKASKPLLAFWQRCFAEIRGVWIYFKHHRTKQFVPEIRANARHCAQAHGIEDQ
jgi:glycosyltransferase involved in cell wall biosynthesis